MLSHFDKLSINLGYAESVLFNIKTKMKNILISCIVFLFAFHQVEGQDMLSSQVIDATTGKSIPYVNVGVVKKGIGTVTDENGFFEFKLPKRLSSEDILQISIVGYTTKTYTLEELRDPSRDFSVIKLFSEPIELQEVFVEKFIEEERTIGYINYTEEHFGYWKDKQGLGGEIATRIRIKKEKTKLLNLNFKLLENKTDSILLRVNVYDYKKRLPSQNMVNSQIYHTVRRGEKDILIDLSPHGIIVDDDIVVSVELVKVYGNQLALAIAGSDTRVISFTRAISQDGWKRYRGKGIAFSVKVGQLKSKFFELNKEREVPERVTVFWDASRSMKKRDFEKEYTLVSTYLQSLNDSKIELVVFNSSLKEVLYFDHRKGISNTSFKEALEQVFYDGIANYDHIAHATDFDPDLVFLFSDATSFIGSLTTMYDAPVFTINSLSQSNEEKLQRLALYTDGHYINLTKTSTDKALSFLQYDLEDFEVYEQKEDKNHWIEGNVSLDSIPLQGVSVRIIGTYVEEVTDADGNFSIEASEGDDLLFSYVGARTEAVKVIEPSLPLIVKMKPEGDLLNEVELIGKTKRKSIPFTKRKRVTYAIDEITSADIDAHYERLEDVLSDKTFVRLERRQGIWFYLFPRGYGGGSGSAIPSLMIDGLIFDQNVAPFIDPQEIASISIVNPLTATNRFGNGVGGGLIVIRTKRFQQGIDGILEEKEEELLNKYTDHLDFYESSFSNVLLIESLIKETNPQSAYQNYKKNSPNSVDVNYFIQAAEIMSKWDQDIAFDIISNVLTLAPENPKLLRIVAGYFEQFKKYKEAAYLYEEIAKIRPLEAQSHRDLAMIYEVNGDYDEAFDLYKRMLVNKINNIDFNKLKPLLTNELNRMVSLYGEELFSDEVLNNFSKINSTMDGRLVLNWSESKAAFKIRFVSPDKRFFDWNSSKSQKFKNATREGFSIEEFVLDDAFKGEWLINLEYSDFTHGNLIPLFIKYTFYKDYGLPNETKEVKMVRLLRENKKVTLSKIIL